MRLKGRRKVVIPAKRAPVESAPPPAQLRQTLDLDDVWTEAAKLYANQRGMKLSRAAWAGLPERLLPDRLAKLTGKQSAKRVSHLLSLLSDSDLRLFHTRAAINVEQAVAAIRLFLIFNISGPVGLVVLITALVPGGTLDAFFSSPGRLLGGLVGVAIAVPFLTWMIWFAFAGVHQARDLYHLATLEMAKRGLAATLANSEQNATEARP